MPQLRADWSTDTVKLKCKICGEIFPLVVGGPATGHLILTHGMIPGVKGHGLRFIDHYDLVGDDREPEKPEPAVGHR